MKRAGRRYSLWCFLAAVAAALALFLRGYHCGQTPTRAEYPYYASQARKEQILRGYPGVAVGMSPEQVTHILGTPDETRPFYEPTKLNPRPLGTTAIYAIYQQTPEPSWYEWKGVLIRYDLKGLVTEIVPIGLSEADGATGGPASDGG